MQIAFSLVFIGWLFYFIAYYIIIIIIYWLDCVMIIGSCVSSGGIVLILS